MKGTTDCIKDTTSIRDPRVIERDSFVRFPGLVSSSSDKKI